MILVAGRGEAEFPRSIETILQQSLQLRDRRQQRQISEQGLAVARGRLEVRMDQSLERRYRSPQNRRLANHLLRERDALFTFLSCPGLEATNWRAEQAIRPMVVTRKVWGGNRTSRGAHTQSILVSILQQALQLRDRRHNERSANTESRWPAEDWKCGWIGPWNGAIAQRRIAVWPTIC